MKLMHADSLPHTPSSPSPNPCLQGINYLISMGVLDDCAPAIADFIHHTRTLNWQSLDQYLQSRPKVLDCLISLQNYSELFLPDALRAFFSKIPAPNERGQFLESLLDKFSTRYVQCNNRTITMSKGESLLENLLVSLPENLLESLLLFVLELVTFFACLYVWSNFLHHF